MVERDFLFTGRIGFAWLGGGWIRVNLQLVLAARVISGGWGESMTMATSYAIVADVFHRRCWDGRWELSRFLFRWARWLVRELAA